MQMQLWGKFSAPLLTRLEILSSLLVVMEIISPQINEWMNKGLVHLKNQALCWVLLQTFLHAPKLVLLQS